MAKSARGKMIKFFCASNDQHQLTRNIILNPMVNRHEVEIQMDNNRDKGLPERYNEFIDRHLNSDAWLVFIHDDVQLLEDIEPKLAGIPKDIIYGACGAKKTNGKGEIVGKIYAQDHRINNGQQITLGREVDGYEIVPTFDPLIIIMHTDLLKDYHALSPDEWFRSDEKEEVKTCKRNKARFDEKLGYHLFSEELSIRAKKNYGINSAVLQLDLCHYSWGTKTPEYYTALEYIHKKHNIKRFIGTCEVSCMDNSTAEDWE